MDDAAEGFKDLSHAFTLFAGSAKKANPEQRGRFNLVEKLVLALSDEVTICTTEGGIRFDADPRHPKKHKLDATIVRPGRLIGIREFRRLNRVEALRLAEAKGLALADQNDYSLAELYCGAGSTPALGAERQIGFAQ